MDDEKPQDDKSIIEKITDTAKTFAEKVVETTSEAMQAAVTPVPGVPNVIIDPGSGTAIVLPPVAPRRKARPAANRARGSVAAGTTTAKKSKAKAARKSRKAAAKTTAARTSKKKAAKKAAPKKTVKTATKKTAKKSVNRTVKKTGRKAVRKKSKKR